jgi:hypothetical protein
MFNKNSYLAPIAAAIIALAAPACASQGGYYRYPTNARIDGRAAYDRGFQEGRQEGVNDARRNRTFDYSRHDEYRDADQGYRGDGNRKEYRRMYRQGFEAGYNDGFRQYARNGGYGGYPGNTRDNGPYDRYPNPNDRAVPRPGYGGYGYSSVAADAGYRDGLDQGRDDARHRRRFDPTGSRQYRSADHNYDRRYGSIDDYRRGYRDGFERGYEQGFRDGR